MALGLEGCGRPQQRCHRLLPKRSYYFVLAIGFHGLHPRGQNTHRTPGRGMGLFWCHAWYTLAWLSPLTVEFERRRACFLFLRGCGDGGGFGFMANLSSYYLCIRPPFFGLVCFHELASSAALLLVVCDLFCVLARVRAD